jgi:uncharacterized protein (TIGR02001 family)
MNSRKTALVILALLITGAAQADVAANLGFASDYYYRGIFQAGSSASGGLDYEHGGFSAGTWVADVKDGLEVDAYFAYGGEVGDFGYSVGYTGYFYTGDFDDTYQEINLGGSFGLFALDVAVGEYDNFGEPKQEYTYYALTVEKNGFYGKYAGFSQDFSGEYFEAGYSATLADFDLGITLLFNDKELSSDGSTDPALIFTVSKSFELK